MVAMAVGGGGYVHLNWIIRQVLEWKPLLIAYKTGKHDWRFHSFLKRWNDKSNEIRCYKQFVWTREQKQEKSKWIHVQQSVT